MLGPLFYSCCMLLSEIAPCNSRGLVLRQNSDKLMCEW